MRRTLFSRYVQAGLDSKIFGTSGSTTPFETNGYCFKYKSGWLKRAAAFYLNT